MENPDDTGQCDSSSDGSTLELLMDKKLAEAKLYVAEKRLNFLLAIGAAILTIFGIVLPMLIASQSANRVDMAIQRLEQKFTELAGKQLRKPRVECYADGKDLVTGLLYFDPKNTHRVLEIKNVGDGTADFIRIRLYVNFDDADFIRDLRNTGWETLGINDKPEFKLMFDYTEGSGVVPAKDSIPVRFWMQNPGLRNMDVKVAALITVFYGEPIPKEVPFTFEIRTK